MANWKENKVVGITAGIIFVISMGLTVFFIFKPQTVEMRLMSEATGAVVMMKVLPNAEFPVVDPKTGKKDLYPAVKLRCADGYEFYEITKPTGQTAMHTCPKDPAQEVTFIQE